MSKKKRMGSQPKYISKGERRSSIKTALKDPSSRILNQLRAFMSGKNVVLTIPNPNKKETNKRFIKVPASSVWRNHNVRRY